MEKTLLVLNELVEKGILSSYAIGGAVGALFYIEPIPTEDLDVLVLLPPGAHALAPLTDVYARLRQMGYREDGPYMMIEGVPVQFLVAYNDLIEEAVRDALQVPYESTMTWIPSPEHLMAIMIQTGRAKDRVRFDQMCEQADWKIEKLRDIAARHKLKEGLQSWLN